MDEEKRIKLSEKRHRSSKKPLQWKFCIKSSYPDEREEQECICIDLDQVKDAVVVVDNDYRVGYLNRAAAEKYNVDQKEALGSKLTDLCQNLWLNPDAEREVFAALERQGYWSGENIHVKKNGDRINVESVASVLKDISGKRIGLIAMIRDISKRKKLEAELQEKEARFRTIVEHSPAIITRMNRDSLLVYVNPSIERVIGVPSAAILGKKWEDIDMPEPVRRDAMEIAYRVFATGKSVCWEHTLHTPLGVKTLESHVVPEFSENGVVETVMGITVDVTERKQVEKVLKGYSRDLEILVRDATDKLLESERFAAIGQTAGMVGHDIRNPLQSIAGELYLQKCEIECLPDSEAKDNLRESINSVEEQVAYINKIVMDLQDFARILVPRFEKVDFEALIQDVLSTVDITESVEVSYSISEGFPTFVTDEGYVKRVLTNLVSNAVQAMPNGGKIDINARCENEKVQVTVEDNGEGIPEEVKDKMFRPLFTTKSKGQGFGLAVVKRLTEALGGSVGFESQVGKGTKFTVELPLRQTR